MSGWAVDTPFPVLLLVSDEFPPEWTLKNLGTAQILAGNRLIREWAWDGATNP